MRPLKKLGLMVLFSGGLLVIACAILRVVLLVADPVNGAQLAGSFAVRETFVAVVTTNLPMVFPLLKTWLAPVFGTLLTSLRSTQRLDDKTPDNIRTFGGGSNQSWRGRGPPTANPITNFTFSESEERIVENVKMESLKAWSDSSTNTTHHGHNNIRKDVEVAIVCEKRSSEFPDRITVPGVEDNPQQQHHQQGHYAYARGPIRGSFGTNNRS
ncbi:hypothetical protein UCREL1_11382 [Eutypa lata UCREL1]|uniref:Integral membrane protein n=1 Tax=Eutypa lata (strain UCR-EL1) TaxID=1287681 RepID=M7S6J8_EUTLA|nr:hypothetical protein UCREL1_11382 [Eutypa lata UCREL1]